MDKGNRLEGKYGMSRLHRERDENYLRERYLRSRKNLTFGDESGTFCQ